MRKPPTTSKFLTTSEAATLLEVSVATLKRWAQAGLLASERTEGGHRRFLRSQLEAFARPPAVADAAATARVDEVLAADTVVELTAVLARGRAAAGSWWACADALRPLFIDLHRRREAGRITAVEWLAFFDRLRAAASRLGDGTPPARDAPALLLASAPGDRLLHGITLAERVVEEVGWEARPAGQARPAELAAELARRPARALLVYASAELEPEDAARTARELAEVAHRAGLPLGLAGLGPWPEPAVGADRLHAFAELRAWLEGLGPRGAASAGPSAPLAANPLAWDPSLKLGDPTIDAQHEALFRTAGAFIEAVRAGEAEPEIERLFGFVEDYAAVHFRFEEGLMRTSGYPHLTVHVWEHDQLVRRLRARAPEGGRPAAGALADLLEGWLSQHVRGSDQRFGEYLRTRKPGQG